MESGCGSCCVPGLSTDTSVTGLSAVVDLELAPFTLTLALPALSLSSLISGAATCLQLSV